ncbi:MAG: RNA polymerase sigma factor [Anaerolineales bacterium]|nr:RNA polymerase sigma factor [Anaerolineales bacterium]
MQAEYERWLLAQIKTDPTVFRELYAYYFPKVYAYIAYRVRRKQDTEDLVSEIFLVVVEQIRDFEYRGEHSFAAWLFRIAYNMVCQFHRQQNRTQYIPLEDLPAMSQNDLSPDHELMKKERFALLSQLISTLSPRRQEIITLKYFGALRNQEIAQILGLDERTIASHLSRGLRELHDKYVESELFIHE